LQQTARQVTGEIKAGRLPPTTSAFDIVRRKYLTALHRQTGRNVILYASKWTQWTPGIEPEVISIVVEDIQGFMEVMHGLGTEPLDMVIHLPGGSAEATEALVSYIRSKFDDVRIFVPHVAMSAATMLACSANRIVMGKHSFLGPIDPQFIVQGDLGRFAVAAYAIEEQFALAKQECQNPALLPAWLPILRQYGPALIVQCKLARGLSESLVADWLERYMLPASTTRRAIALQIAASLADHSKFKSHSRFIDRNAVKGFGLVVDDLEADQGLQDAVLSVFHATAHTFNGSPTVKIIENHLGKAFIKSAQAQVIMQRQPLGATPPGPGATPPGPP